MKERKVFSNYDVGQKTPKISATKKRETKKVVTEKKETGMDIGQILRDRSSIPVYESEPEKKENRWGIYPSMKIDQMIFMEDDEFKYQVSLFAYDQDEILRIQDAAIAEAQEGLKKNGWKFWLHSARHSIQKIGKLYHSEINFIFKVGP